MGEGDCGQIKKDWRDLANIRELRLSQSLSFLALGLLVSLMHLCVYILNHLASGRIEAVCTRNFVHPTKPILGCAIPGRTFHRIACFAPLLG